MADYNSDRTGSNIDLTLDKVDALDAKVQPTATGVDVTGTITADGLSLGSATGRIINLYESAGDIYGFSMANLGDGFSTNIIGGQGGSVKITTRPAGGSNTERLKVGANGNVSFYEDTGTTAKMVWSSSAESLGIGTASPNKDLHLYGAGDTGIQITKEGSVAAQVKTVAGALSFGVDGANGTTERMRIDSAGNVGIGTASPSAKVDILAGGDQRFLVSTVSDDVSLSAVNGANTAYQELFINGSTLKMATGGTERARIDSNGALLVGKTNDLFATVGSYMGANGVNEMTTDGTHPLRLNRKSNDGAIVTFNKDGSTVGSIGALTSQVYIGSGDTTGLIFHKSPAFIGPKDASNPVALDDANISLGWTNQRFKDLYLSGGVKTGGNSTSPVLVEDNQGIMMRFVVTDVLQAGEKTRFTFNLGNRRGGLVKIKAVGAYTASNNTANHPAAEYTVKLLGFSDGNTTDGGIAQLDYGYVYSLSDYTFTGLGGGNCTIDLRNPTGSPNVLFSYIIEIVNPASYATILTSVTTI